MKKNSDMRKQCATKPASPRNALGELSTIDHTPGGRPGRNDIAAWKATPNKSANPRTASSACRRFSGTIELFMLESLRSVVVAAAGREQVRQADGEREDD